MAARGHNSKGLFLRRSVFVTLRTKQHETCRLVLPNRFSKRCYLTISELMTNYLSLHLGTCTKGVWSIFYQGKSTESITETANTLPEVYEMLVKADGCGGEGPNVCARWWCTSLQLLAPRYISTVNFQTACEPSMLSRDGKTHLSLLGLGWGGMWGSNSSSAVVKMLSWEFEVKACSCTRVPSQKQNHEKIKSTVLVKLYCKR